MSKSFRLFRLFGIEFLENFPGLFGLLLALQVKNLLYALSIAISGVILSSLLIWQLEHIKVAKSRESLRQLFRNLIAFVCGLILFVIYWNQIRTISASFMPLFLSDTLAGILMGVVITSIQCLKSGIQRKFVHAFSLAVAIVFITILIGLLHQFNPFITAFAIDLVATLIICFIEYKKHIL